VASLEASTEIPSGGSLALSKSLRLVAAVCSCFVRATGKAARARVNPDYLQLMTLPYSTIRASSWSQKRRGRNGGNDVPLTPLRPHSHESTMEVRYMHEAYQPVIGHMKMATWYGSPRPTPLWPLSAQLSLQIETSV